MNSKRSLQHDVYYIVELLVLSFGFLLVTTFSYNFGIQATILSTVLLAYIIMGYIHHKENHDLKVKIMVEYILISLLVLSFFVFLNSARL